MKEKLSKDLSQQEKLQRAEEGYRFTILRPGGNDTCLINGIVENSNTCKKINDSIMQFYPNVEQTGFVNLSSKNLELKMAGGEFCANATRSTVWLALKGKSGEVEIKVSGVSNKLKAGVDRNGETYAQMPIYPETSKIITDSINPQNKIVEMQGITHYINFNTSGIENLNEKQIKAEAMNIIREKNLERFTASGVIYVQKKNKTVYKITPVVYVRDINTLFLETACGSGTAALGLVLALQSEQSIKDIPIIQPSGLPIKISVAFNGKSFGYTQIKGSTQMLNEGVLKETTDKNNYLIERIITYNQLKNTLYKDGLIELYQKVFSESPYFEQFSPKEVKSFFNDYWQNGVLFIARNKDKVIGFAASIPLSSQKEIAELADKNGINPTRCWYNADLGVSKEYRRQGIGKSLAKERLRVFPSGATVIMRTSENNIAARSLNDNLGFKIIEGMIQEVKQKRVDGTVKTDKRIFLCKEL